MVGRRKDMWEEDYLYNSVTGILDWCSCHSGDQQQVEGRIV